MLVAVKMAALLWCCSMHNVVDGILYGRYLELMVDGIVMLDVVMGTMVVVIWCCSMHTVVDGIF